MGGSKPAEDIVSMGGWAWLWCGVDHKTTHWVNVLIVENVMEIVGLFDGQIA